MINCEGGFSDLFGILLVGFEEVGMMGAGWEILNQRCVWRLMGKTWTSGGWFEMGKI
jgi:hypothetical protein